MHLSKSIPSCPFCGGETICFAESDCHDAQGNIVVDAYCGCYAKECGKFCEDSCKLPCGASDEEILKASAELLEKVIKKWNHKVNSEFYNYIPSCPYPVSEPICYNHECFRDSDGKIYININCNMWNERCGKCCGGVRILPPDASYDDIKKANKELMHEIAKQRDQKLNINLSSDEEA